jgi:hypothetical protein
MILVKTNHPYLRVGRHNNAIIGRLVITKLMAIPHYVYLAFKMLGPNEVILLKVERKHALACVEIILTLEAFPEIDVGLKLHVKTSWSCKTPLWPTTILITSPNQVHLDA